MEPFSLTEAQERAVKTLGQNLVVEAGAGSGKTSVLTERYLHLIKKGLSHHQILAITFTEKAADEMRRRITSRYPLPADEIWISTIHSFCAKLLRHHPVEAGVDPLFQIIDETTAQMRRDQAVSRYLNKLLRASSQPLRSLLKAIEISKLQNILHLVLRDRREVTDTEKHHSLEDVHEWVFSDPMWKRAITLLRSAAGSSECKVEQRRQRILSIVDNLEDNLVDIRSETSLSSCKRSSWDSESLEKVKEAFSLLKEIFKRIDTLLSFEEEGGVGQVRQDLTSLVEGVRQEYQSSKERRGELDFEDLLIIARQLLRKKGIRKRYQEQFQHVMVDEFQDTNQIQYDLVKLLTSDNSGTLLPGHIFVVGDPKQSIYRFRGADVSLFKKVTEEVVESGGEQIFLTENFRSSPSILKAVNAAFENLFPSDRDAIPFHALIPKGNAIGPEPTMLQIPDGEGKREIEAKHVLEYIKERIAEGIQPEDIVLLFRGSAQISPYEAALRMAKIPCRSHNDGGLFEQTEIYDLLNLLHYIDDPSNHLALVGLLRSPIIGLTDEAIAEMFVNENLNSPDSFNEKISTLRQLKDTIPLSLFLHKAIQESDLDLLQINDEGRKNLFKFVSFAEAMSKTPIKLSTFLQRIEKLIAEGVAQGKSDNVDISGGVQLMTVHKAKGLEFPVVIIPDLSYRPNPRSATVNLTEDGCIEPKDGNFNYAWSQFLDRDKSIAESKRLFYVATTRAISHLVLCVKEKSLEKKIDSTHLRKDSWEAWGQLLNLSPYNPGKIKKIDLNVVSKKPIEVIGSEDWKPISEFHIETSFQPVSTTITEMSLYKSCPLAHHYRYREDILISENEDLKPGYGSKVGDWTHLVLQNWYPFDSDLKEVVSKVEVPEELRGRVRRLASSILDRKVSSCFEGKKEGVSELHFMVPQDDNLVEGVIDLALFDGEGWEIIDYKTNKLSKDNLDNLVERYRFQMESYGVALKKATKSLVKKLTLIFLDGPFKVEIPWGEDVAEECEESWRAILKGMVEESSVPNQSYCPSCIFRSWCPESLLVEPIKTGYIETDERN